MFSTTHRLFSPRSLLPLFLLTFLALVLAGCANIALPAATTPQDQTQAAATTQAQPADDGATMPMAGHEGHHMGAGQAMTGTMPMTGTMSMGDDMMGMMPEMMAQLSMEQRQQLMQHMMEMVGGSDAEMAHDMGGMSDEEMMGMMQDMMAKMSPEQHQQMMQHMMEMMGGDMMGEAGAMSGHEGHPMGAGQAMTSTMPMTGTMPIGGMMNGGMMGMMQDMMTKMSPEMMQMMMQMMGGGMMGMMGGANAMPGQGHEAHHMGAGQAMTSTMPMTGTMPMSGHEAHHMGAGQAMTSTMPMTGTMPMGGMMNGDMMGMMKDMMAKMSPEMMQMMMQMMGGGMMGMMGGANAMPGQGHEGHHMGAGQAMTGTMPMGDMTGGMAGHMAPIPSTGVPDATETTGGQPLSFKVEDGVKVFELTAKPVRWNILDGVTVTAWTYNSTVPGPMIRVTAGDKVRVILKNELPEPTSIHWHGIPVPNEMDGMTPILPGETLTYEFTAPPAGSFMYHSHISSDRQVMVGMYAPLIVDPRRPERNPPAVDVSWMLSEWRVGADGQTYPAMPMAGSEPNYFTINGKAYPATQAIEVKKGDRVRIRLANIGQFTHPMHLHGMNFKVVAIDGVALPREQQMVRNTIPVNPGELIDIEFTANKVGEWMFHCHVLHHVTNDGVEPGGLLAVVKVTE